MKLRLLTILILTFGTTNFTQAMKRSSIEQKAARDARAAARNLKRSRGGSGGGDDDKTPPTRIAAAASVATSERGRGARSRYFYLAPEERFRRAICEDRAPTLALQFFTEDSILLTHFEYPYKMTALHYAAMEGYLELINAIIAAGANINAQSSPTILTPLHLAAGYGHIECVRALLAAPDINPLHQDKVGRTAADVALNAEIRAIIQEKIDALTAAAQGDEEEFQQSCVIS